MKRRHGAALLFGITSNVPRFRHSFTIGVGEPSKNSKSKTPVSPAVSPPVTVEDSVATAVVDDTPSVIVMSAGLCKENRGCVDS